MNTSKALFWAKFIAEIVVVGAISLISELLKALFSIVQPRKCKDIKGETVLVTGAAQGIGRELAIQLARLGADVICVDVNAEGNLKTAQDITKLGYKTRALTCDLSDAAAVEKLSRDAGCVDILINNAGLIDANPVLDTPQSGVSKMLDINIASHFAMIRNFLPGMIKRNKGHIVATASSGGLMGLANAALYSCTKFAVVGLMDSLAQELRDQGHHNIKLTTVCPYFVKTIPEIATNVVARVPALEIDEVIPGIVQGILEERSIFTVPYYMQTLFNTARFLPNNTYLKVRDVMYARIIPMAAKVGDNGVTPVSANSH